MDTITLNVPTLPCVGLAAVAGLLACKLIAPRNDNDGARGSPPAWLDELEGDWENFPNLLRGIFMFFV